MTRGESTEPGELEEIAKLLQRLPKAPSGQTYLGDDAAVVHVGGTELLFASDLITEHVHFEKDTSSLADIGWKALSVNLSDIAAMGGRPTAAVVAIAGASAAEVDELYDGILEASVRFSCPVVGGDLSSGDLLTLSVALLGVTDQSPVLRTGGAVGDLIFVTGPLGASAAGLRELRKGLELRSSRIDAHRRPRPRLIAGQLAARAGASAMIDLSDGLGLDLDRLARASKVGVVLKEVPIAVGATLDDALHGGEDYELCFTARDRRAIEAAFCDANEPLPICIGTVVADEKSRQLLGEELAIEGYVHELGMTSRGRARTETER